MNVITGAAIESGGGGAPYDGSTVTIGTTASTDDVAVEMVTNTSNWRVETDVDGSNRPFKVRKTQIATDNGDCLTIDDSGTPAFPQLVGGAGQFVSIDAAGTLGTGTPVGAGDVSSISTSSVDNSIARFDSTTGKVIQAEYNAGLEPTISNAGQITLHGAATVNHNLTCARTDAVASVTSRSVSSTAVWQSPDVIMQRARNGGGGAPAAIINNDHIGKFKYNGHNGSSYVTAAQIRGVAKETFSGSARGCSLEFRTNVIGQATNDGTLSYQIDSQANNNFKTPVRANSLDRETGGTLTIGGTTATQIDIGSTFTPVDISTFRLMGNGATSVMGGLSGTTFLGGTSTTSFGVDALGSLTGNPNENTAFGNEAGGNITTGSGNVCIGYRAGFSLLTNIGNVMIGRNSAGNNLKTNQISIGETATCDENHQCTIGNGFTYTIRPGGDNTCDLGEAARRYERVFFGTSLLGPALDRNTAGTLTIGGTTATQVDVGAETIPVVVAGARVEYDGTNQNLFVASDPTALVVNTAQNNIGFGTRALDAITTGRANVAIGSDALGASTTGINNVGIGLNAGDSIQTGGSNLAIGTNACGVNVSGSGNVCLGHSAGQLLTSNQNVLIGVNAGNSIVGGQDNVCLGHDSDVAAGLDNQIALGRGATTTAANTCQIGNGSLTMINSSARMHIGIPTHVTASRVANLEGQLAYATDTSELEIYESGTWKPAGAGGGNVSSTDATSVANAICRFHGTGGTTIKDDYTASVEPTISDGGVVNVPAGLTTDLSVDRATAGAFNVGTTTATSVNVGSESIPAIVGGARLEYNASDANLFIVSDPPAWVAATAQDNVAIGNNALLNLEDGKSNVGIGTAAMTSITDAANCIAIGNGAGTAITTGSENISIGTNAGAAIVTGVDNVSIGHSSGLLLTGNSSTFVGTFAGDSVTTGQNNTCIGRSSDAAPTLLNQTAIGFQATCDASNQVTLGNGSVTHIRSMANCDLGSGSSEFKDIYTNGTLVMSRGTDNISIGPGTLGALSTGSDNIAIGNGAGASIDVGVENIAIGHNALDSLTSSTGSNVAIGANALGLMTGGPGNNVALGPGCLSAVTTGQNNMCIGLNAGSTLSIGNYNLCWGDNARTKAGHTNPAHAAVNAVAIGSGTVSEDDHFVCGNVNMLVVRPSVNNLTDLGTAAIAWQDVYTVNPVTVTSDMNKKELVPGVTFGLDEICKLTPIAFKWKDETDVPCIKYTYDSEGNMTGSYESTKTVTHTRTHHGFSAQDIETLINNGDIADCGLFCKSPTGEYMLRYAELIAPMVTAIKELCARVVSLEAQVAALSP